MESMGKRLQQLESQQHDYKNAELSWETPKNP